MFSNVLIRTKKRSYFEVRRDSVDATRQKDVAKRKKSANDVQTGQFHRYHLSRIIITVTTWYCRWYLTTLNEWREVFICGRVLAHCTLLSNLLLNVTCAWHHARMFLNNFILNTAAALKKRVSHGFWAKLLFTFLTWYMPLSSQYKYKVCFTQSLHDHKATVCRNPSIMSGVGG